MEIFSPSITICPQTWIFLICYELNSFIAFVIVLKLLFPLNLGPKIGKFGLQLSLKNLSIFFSIFILSTLISSSIHGKNYFRSTKRPSFWLKIDNDIIGCFKEMFLFSLSFLAVSMMLIVVIINSLTRQFFNFSIEVGMSK